MKSKDKKYKNGKIKNIVLAEEGDTLRGMSFKNIYY